MLQKKLSAIIYLNESRVMGSWKTAQYEDIREDTDMSKTKGWVTLPGESGFLKETMDTIILPSGSPPDNSCQRRLEQV